MTRIRSWLQQRSDATITTYAIAAAFTAYFCMYAFRKPFAAAAFEGDLADTGIALKTSYVVAQLVGYTLSKFLGTKFNAELESTSRRGALLGLVGFSWLSLALLAVLPTEAGMFALFLNGLPLGMVWGVVVSCLEGRRSSELMLAGLSCSFILASGVVKDVGRALLSMGVAEATMPAAVGAIFVLPYAASVLALTSLPPPTAQDVAMRSERTTMDGQARWSFVKDYIWVLLPLLFVYTALTAIRDFRDNYGAELFAEVGYGDTPGVFSASEVPVALSVILALGLLAYIRDNGRALTVVYALMIGGVLTCGAATFALEQGWIGGLAWMIWVGIGSYVAYVPFGSMLFERLFAYTRATGTAVFAIYLADATGYSGSILLQFLRDLVGAESQLGFFSATLMTVSAFAPFLLVASGFALKRAPRNRGEGTQEPTI